MVVASKSTPTDLSVATSGLQVPASQGEKVEAAAACSLGATTGLTLKPKVHCQLPDFCSCSTSSLKYLEKFMCPGLNLEKERCIE